MEGERKKEKGKDVEIIHTNHWIYQREVLYIYIQTIYVLQKIIIIRNGATVIFRKVKLIKDYLKNIIERIIFTNITQIGLMII